MYVWPVPQWIPSYSYHQRPRSFGAPRSSGKRRHAGCDLYAPEGSPVRAVWHGRVINVYEFYGKADAVEVDHGTLGVVRYGEINVDKDAVRTGLVLQSGDTIGSVARLAGMGDIHPMVHFELYSGRGQGKLTQPGNDFKRRADLLDPTQFLDRIRFMAYESLFNVA